MLCNCIIAKMSSLEIFPTKALIDIKKQGNDIIILLEVMGFLFYRFMNN